MNITILLILFCLHCITLGRCFMPNGDSILVDSQYGNDVTCSYGDASLPCSSFDRATQILETLPAKDTLYVIQAKSGVYNETVILNQKISIVGMGGIVQVNGVEIYSTSSLYNIHIHAINHEAVIIDCPSQEQVVTLFGVYIHNEWNIPTSRVDTILHISGTTTFLNGEVYTSVNAPVSGLATAVTNYGSELEFRYFETFIEVFSDAGNVSVFNSQGPVGSQSSETNLKYNYGQPKAQSRGYSENTMICRSAWSNVEFLGSRANINAKHANTTVSIIYAVGDVTSKFSLSTINLKGNSDALYSATGEEQDGQTPDVRFYAATPVKVPFPDKRGVFSSYSISTIGVEGFQTNGGIYMKTLHINQTYTIQSDDAIIVVDSGPLDIHFPVPYSMNPTIQSAGKLLWVKNLSTQLVTLKGAFTLGDMSSLYMIPHSSIQLVSDDSYWYVISRM